MGRYLGALLIALFIVLAPLCAFAAEVSKSTADDEGIVIIDLRKKPQASKPAGKTESQPPVDSDISVIDLSRARHVTSPLPGETRVVILEGAPVPSQPVGSSAGREICTDYLPMIQEIAARYHMDPQLVKLVIEVESGFNPRAVSPMNAKGLMQIMPETAASLNLADPFDPYSNIEAGVKYLRLQLDRFGCLEFALAAYNAGPGAVEKYGGIPPYEETQSYVNTILGRYYGGE